jgi:hypothetical protein
MKDHKFPPHAPPPLKGGGQGQKEERIFLTGHITEIVYQIGFLGIISENTGG